VVTKVGDDEKSPLGRGTGSRLQGKTKVRPSQGNRQKGVWGDKKTTFVFIEWVGPKQQRRGGGKFRHENHSKGKREKQ